MKRRYEKYAWPGGYPMFYMNKHDEVICPDCAIEYNVRMSRAGR